MFVQLKERSSFFSWIISLTMVRIPTTNSSFWLVRDIQLINDDTIINSSLRSLLARYPCCKSRQEIILFWPLTHTSVFIPDWPNFYEYFTHTAMFSKNPKTVSSAAQKGWSSAVSLLLPTGRSGKVSIVFDTFLTENHFCTCNEWYAKSWWIRMVIQHS